MQIRKVERDESKAKKKPVQRFLVERGLEHLPPELKKELWGFRKQITLSMLTTLSRVEYFLRNGVGGGKDLLDEVVNLKNVIAKMEEHNGQTNNLKHRAPGDQTQRVLAGIVEGRDRSNRGAKR